MSIAGSVRRAGVKVLILGAGGMLGHKVFQVLNDRFEVWAGFRDSDGPWRRNPIYQGCASVMSGLDALDFDTVARAVTELGPNVVINCIGIVKQVKEESDPITCLMVNSVFPHRLAEICVANRSRLVHISTDCVFSGRKGNYTEDDTPDAEDLYGRTKLLGEVTRRGCLTIRTSFFGRDFNKTDALLEWFLSHRGGMVEGFKNAIFSGFPTVVLARVIGDLVADHPGLHGVYHIASQPISKHDLLVKVRDAIRVDVEVEPVEEPRCDRSLNPARFVEATSYHLPGWDQMVAELAADRTPYDEWRERHAII